MSIIVYIPNYFHLAKNIPSLIIEHVLIYSLVLKMATAGRKKKCRTIAIDFKNMPCTCFGPITLTKEQLKDCEKIILEPDEFQTLVYQDIEKYTMAQGCEKMCISKTVYAGLYERAREKVTYALLNNCVLTLACPN